jgi:hypothetical protein
MAQLHSSVLAKPALVQAGLRKCLTFSFALLNRLAGRTIRFQTRRDLLMRHEPAINDNKRKLDGATRGLAALRRASVRPRATIRHRRPCTRSRNSRWTTGGLETGAGVRHLDLLNTESSLDHRGCVYHHSGGPLVGYVLQTGSGARTGPTLGNGCSATPPSKA